MRILKQIFAFAIVATFLSSCGYNSMVEEEENISLKWADVETQYQRRSDLIPNLVSTVKGYAEFEKETLTGVIEARSKATSVTFEAKDLTPENLAKFEAAQKQVSGALSRLLVSVERYPELKANQGFLDLQAQLEGTENRIAVARKNYNGAVKTFNANIRKFPRNIMAGWFDFEKKAYFEAAEGSEDAPSVEF
jgi:LemA protein